MSLLGDTCSVLPSPKAFSAWLCSDLKRTYIYPVSQHSSWERDSKVPPDTNNVVPGERTTNRLAARVTAMECLRRADLCSMRNSLTVCCIAVEVPACGELQWYDSVVTDFTNGME